MHRFLTAILTFLILAFATGLFAETPEQVINPKSTANGWVSDMAQAISPADEQRLAGILSTLEEKRGVEMAVVTIRRTDGRNPKDFATDLFNRWGVGKKAQDNGVLVLLVTESRRIEVETGYGVEDVLPDGKIGDILDRYVIPRFRQGDYGGGLVDGVREMSNVLMRQPELERDGEDTQSGGASFFTLLLFLAFVGVIGYFIYRRFQQRCPKCESKMRLLDARQEKAYLSADQQFEEEIGSIDYRVWHCDECQTVTVKRKFFRGFTKCPTCGRRTVRLKSYLLEAPTYTRDGVREVEQKCLYPTCDFHRRTQKRIPRRVRQRAPRGPNISGFPTSGRGGGFGGFGGGFGSGGGFSGGGSFGGGGSGGGGAGRSW